MVSETKKHTESAPRVFIGAEDVQDQNWINASHKVS